MDLDNIKKTWQETKLNSVIDEEKIQKMLSNEGKGAFNTLLRYEKLSLILLVLVIPVGYFIFGKYMPVAVVYICTTILSLIWQIYKLRKFKQIDVVSMGITEVSSRFYWYRKSIMKEFCIGIIWFIGFFIMYGYFEMLHDIHHNGRIPIALIIASIIGLILSIACYKLLYWDNIKKFENAITELKEFEERE